MNELDPIERLLKATGPRPAVPADRTERVRDAVGARWMSEVARHARRRRIGWALSLASAAVVAAAVGLGIRSFLSSTTPELSGVRVERALNFAPLPMGSIVPRGFAVTTGPDVRVALRAPTGHSLRLDTGTILQVRSDREFVLERGAVYVESQGGPFVDGTSIRIDTPVGTIEDQGTQFEARWNDGSLSVRVREGAVTIQSSAGRLAAEAGHALRLDASGRVDRTEEEATGAAWTWAESIAPAMEIEGRFLRDFLKWVVRERGVRLRFADPGLEGKAETIVLSGSIAGMTLEEATTSVLATCGLTHRWERGVLVVGSQP